MVVPVPPTNLRLFGTTPAERENSRESHQIRIDFDHVIGADVYQVKLSDESLVKVQPGDFVIAPGPNRRCDIAVRAIMQGQASAWSKALVTVTRPPVPAAPARAPFDLSAFGIVLAWRYDHAFPGHQQTQLQLYRTWEGSAKEVIADALERSGRYVDTTYPASVEKLYRLIAVTARAAVPDDLLGGPNPSLVGPATRARGPHSAIPPGRIEHSLSRERSHGQAILTMYGYPSLRG